MIKLIGLLPSLTASLSSSSQPYFFKNIDPLVLALIGTLLVGFLSIAAPCFIFKKAGRKWWEALIPFYGSYIMGKYILKKSEIWAIFYTISPFIFFISPYFNFAVPILLCESFGYSPWLGVLMPLGRFASAILLLSVFFPPFAAISAVLLILSILAFAVSQIPYSMILFGNHQYMKNKTLLELEDLLR